MSSTIDSVPCCSREDDDHSRPTEANPARLESTMNSRGFTLMEVIVTLGILAIALPVLLGLRNWDVGLHDRARHLAQATRLAQEKLLETQLAGPVPLGVTSGDFGTYSSGLGVPQSVTAQQRAPGYSWTRTISATSLSTLREVRIEIRWQDKTGEDVLDVNTYVLF